MRKYLIALALLAAACGAKHSCEFENDAQKAALGDVPNMTGKSVTCFIDGAAVVGGSAHSDEKCTVGGPDCVPIMETVHGDGAKVEDIANRFRGWLKENGWKIEKDAAADSEAGNGKKLVGVELVATKGDGLVSSRIFPFGDSLVQARTFVQLKKL